MNSKDKLSFVIPCFRSEETVQFVVNEILEIFCPLTDNFEIILVDDNSPDNVWETIRTLAESNPHVMGLQLSKNMGQHAALMAGYRHASGNIIISLDDDGQSPVDELPNLLQKLDEGYDVVFASYPEKKYGLFRNFGSRVNDLMANFLIGKPRTLILNSVFVMRRFVMDEMLRYRNPYPYISGLVLRSTAHICNVPVKHRPRQMGSSGYTLSKLFALWFNGFTSFSVKPLRISMLIGCICALVGFVMALYVTINKILHPATLAGYSSLMAVLLFIGGLIMMMLGLIGEYIGRIYICINQSPQYVIRQMINIDEREEKTST